MVGWMVNGTAATAAVALNVRTTVEHHLASRNVLLLLSCFAFILHFFSLISWCWW